MFIKYSGPLGTFSYDPDVFKVDLVYDNDHDELDNLYCLRYVGKDTDLSHLKLPEGLVNARYMFDGSDVIIPPVLPEGITNGTCMFRGSMIERAPALPSSLRNADFMFEATPIYKAPLLPASLKSGIRMFADCPNLTRRASSKSSSVQNFFGMYDGCPHFQQKKESEDPFVREVEKFAEEEELPFL